MNLKRVRVSKVRVGRLRIILADLRAGKTVKEIAELHGYKKDRVYHEMYYLKKLGLIEADMKNIPQSIYTDDVASVIAKGVE